MGELSPVDQFDAALPNLTYKSSDQPANEGPPARDEQPPAGSQAPWVLREQEPQPEVAPWALSSEPADATPWDDALGTWVMSDAPAQQSLEQARLAEAPAVPPSAPHASPRAEAARAHEQQRGAVFARLATEADPQVPAPSQARAASIPAAGQPGFGRPAVDQENDLWFLSGEPAAEMSTAETTAESEPSSIQTAILTVLVALGVIALVILFLALFTSFFA
jgi:hypothetical protein